MAFIAEESDHVYIFGHGFPKEKSPAMLKTLSHHTLYARALYEVAFQRETL